MTGTAAMRTGSWTVLLVLAGNLLIDTIEVSSVFVLLPALAADLGLSPEAAALVAAAFPLGFVAGIPLAGPTADRFGVRRVLVLSLLCFAAAGVLSALSSDVADLAAARLVKGLSAGLTTPLGNRVLATAFVDAADRERATRLYSLVGGAGFVAGLLLTAPLLTSSWRLAACWTAPAALVLAVAAGRWIGEVPVNTSGSRPTTKVPTIAWAGLLPTVAGVAMALLPLPASVRVVGGVLAAVLVVMVVTAPLHRLLPDSAARAFAWNAATAALFNGSFLLFFAVAQEQLQATSLGPLGALAAAPVGLGMALVVPLTGRIVRSMPLARLIAASATCAGIAYLGAALAGPPSIGTVVVISSLIGVAFVLGFVPLNLRAVAAVPSELRVPALGTYQVLVQAGAALALPLGVAGAALAGTSSSTWRAAPVLAVAGGALLLAALGALMTSDESGGR